MREKGACESLQQGEVQGLSRGPLLWGRHSPAQEMRRIWPLLTWPTTLRRPASVSHTKGMHCGAAERKQRATVRVPAVREEGLQPCIPQLNADHVWRGETPFPVVRDVRRLRALYHRC